MQLAQIRIDLQEVAELSHRLGSEGRRHKNNAEHGRNAGHRRQKCAKVR